MCGRFAINDEMNDLLTEIVDQHGIKALSHWQDFVPRYNIAPTEQVVTILHSAKRDEDVITTARWSLTPPWSETLQTKFPTFNARTEAITEKASWKVVVS